MLPRATLPSIRAMSTYHLRWFRGCKVKVAWLAPVTTKRWVRSPV